MSGSEVDRSAGWSDRLTHIDDQGRARMVDVSGKPPTGRVAEARCLIRTTAEAAQKVQGGSEGIDLFASARWAGIQAAKQTALLVPLCHPLLVDRVEVDLVVGSEGIHVRGVAGIVERTGVEMEALTACTFAALTLLPPLLVLDASASIEELAVWFKSGGRSGTWRRSEQGGSVMIHEDPV